MSDAAFYDQIYRTLAWEGGYVNNPDDPGGETNFGITKRSYPDLDIASITQQDAIAIYKRDYWDDTGLTQLLDPVAAKCFDLGVNMGPSMAIRLLQRALVLNSTKLVMLIDGKLGPITVLASKTGSTGNLLAALRGTARCHYLEIAAAKPSSRQFLDGWLRRANA